MKKQVLIECEAIAGAWSRRTENSQGVTDAWLKFYLPDEDAIDAMLSHCTDDDFRGNKKSGGKLFRITIEEYTDLQDTPYEYQPQKTMKPSQVAALICKDSLFADFVRQFCKPIVLQMMKENLFTGDESYEEKNAKLIRYICSIESRAELDTSEAAESAFNEYIRQPFKKYRRNIAHTA